MEASLILPLFIMTALFFFMIGNLLQTRLIVYDAMQDTAQCLAEYQYALEQGQKDKNMTVTGLTGMGIDTLAARERLQHYLAASALDENYISGGITGIHVMSTGYSESDGCIVIKLKYKLRMDIPLLGEMTWKVKEQIRQRAMNGMRSENAAASNSGYVYITQTGGVCHSSRSCYHIRLTIRQIEKNRLKTEYKNLTPCELCAENRVSDGAVYITETGNRYHNSVACSGLKRTVMRVKKEAAADMPACSNCGK